MSKNKSDERLERTRTREKKTRKKAGVSSERRVVVVNIVFKNKKHERRRVRDDSGEREMETSDAENLRRSVIGKHLERGQNFGLDPSVVERIAGEIVAASMSGVEIAVVVGGGNFFEARAMKGRIWIARQRIIWGCWRRL